MKRLLILSLLSIIGFAACNPQSKNKTETTSTESNDTPAAPIFKDINVAEFKGKMSDPSAIIIDVRTPEEIADGKIDGALEIDFQADGFTAQLDQLDKEKTYLVYCRSGNRSGQTCDMMKEKGFREFYNLDGGFNAWSEQ